VKDLERVIRPRHAALAVHPARLSAAVPTAWGSGSAGTPTALLVNRNDQIRQGYSQRIDEPHDRRPPRVGLSELDARQAAHGQLRFPRQAFLGPTALLAQGTDGGRQGLVSGRRGLGHNIRPSQTLEGQVYGLHHMLYTTCVIAPAGSYRCRRRPERRTRARCAAKLTVGENDVMHRTQAGRVRLRLATAADATAIAKLHADSWRRHYRGAYSDAFLDGDVLVDRLAVWSELLEQPDPRRCTILAEEDRLVGFANTILEHDPTWGALLDNLHVAHDRRHRGIGSRLLAVTARAVAEDPRRTGLYVWVLEQNLDAQVFYGALDGTRVGREPVSPPGGIPSRLTGSPAKLRYAWTERQLRRLVDPAGVEIVQAPPAR
jgi:GNAT superfamily N-acetyltransferase